MERDLIKERLESLPSYQDWQLAASDQQEAFRATADKFNIHDREHLAAQIHYLDARDVQFATRELVKLEVAQQDDRFLPLAYKLGTLAALTEIEDPSLFRVEGNGIEIHRGLGLTSLRLDAGEQRVYPSGNVPGLAAQIGDELERLKGLMDHRRPVPVAMVWNHRDTCGHGPDEWLDEIILGVIDKPREAIELAEPTIIDPERRVEFSLPSTLRGVRKTKVVTYERGYNNPAERYQNPRLPVITQLAPTVTRDDQHFGVDSPSAVYIGKTDVDQRLAKAQAMLARRQEHHDRLSDSRSRRRPRLIR